MRTPESVVTSPVSRAKRPPRERLALLTLCLLYGLLGTFYWRPILVLAKPDENAHLLYVYEVQQGRWLPRRQPAPSGLWEVDERHQPPLYYWLTALVTRPTPVPDPRTWVEENPFFLHRAPRGNAARALPKAVGLPFVFAIRAFSWLLGLLVIAGTYRAARAWLPPRWALLGTAGLVLTPTFLFIQTAASNTALATGLNALAFMTLMRMWQRRVTPTRARWLILWWTLALYTRLDSAFLGAAVLLLLMREIRCRRPTWRTVAGALVATGGLLVPLLVRNAWLYGDPLVRHALALRPAPLPWRALLTQEVERLFKTTFISVGEGFTLAPDAYYLIPLTLLLLAVLGWTRRQAWRSGKDTAGFLLGTLLPLWGSALLATRRYYMDAPRYILSLATPTVLLVAAGYRALWPRGLRRWSAGLALIAWGMLNVATIAGVIWPVYVPRPAPRFPAVLAVFENGIVLRHATVTLQADGIAVSLVWETRKPVPENWAVFVHGYDAAGTLVTQEDTHPVYGAYPTALWRPHTPFWDPHRLPWPASSSSPLRLVVGLYRPDTQQRLPAFRPDGTPWPHAAVPIGTVSLPSEGFSGEDARQRPVQPAFGVEPRPVARLSRDVKSPTR